MTQRLFTARRIVAVALVCAGFGLLGAAGSSAKGSKHRVQIQGDYARGYKFSPKSLSIKVGQSVTWSWSSDARHNVTFGHKRHSKTRKKMSGFVLAFKKAGTFRYHCTIHGFKGTIIVK